MARRKKKLPTKEALGREFAKTLWYWAQDKRLWDGEYSHCKSPLQLWRAMRKNNSKYGPNDGICCSGDWCDSNMAMDAAFREFGINPLPPNEDGMPNDINELWNAAWDYAAVKWLGRRAVQ